MGSTPKSLTRLPIYIVVDLNPSGPREATFPRSGTPCPWQVEAPVLSNKTKLTNVAGVITPSSGPSGCIFTVRD